VTGSLPRGAAPYKRTPSFTEISVPPGLLKDHSTKEGTWGLITVEQGSLRYFITDPRTPPAETIVSPETPAIVEPTILHRVEPVGAVRFHVVFFREEPFAPA
jgi:tellurite resistance-related uncharacterized protein